MTNFSDLPIEEREEIADLYAREIGGANLPEWIFVGLMLESIERLRSIPQEPYDRERAQKEAASRPSRFDLLEKKKRAEIAALKI